MLSDKEKTIVLISNAIAVYSLYQARGDLSKNASMVDFILKTIPEEMRDKISIELIDEVFEFVSNSHSS
ncbi:MAG TPA: hypothetical protein VLC72_05085 [Nitrosopumilaceae archaeon]|nr:hypothetical protein [Nitrosopumilaceae archaeon]